MAPALQQIKHEQDVWRITDVEGRTFISPSGKTALFRDKDTLRRKIYEVATRKRLYVFDEKALDEQPAWSPDVRRIVFAKGDNSSLPTRKVVKYFNASRFPPDLVPKALP